MGVGDWTLQELVTMSTMDTLDTLVEAARGWYLFPPTEEQKRVEKQEKFLLLSDNGSTQDNLFSLNWIGLMIALIIILFCCKWRCRESVRWVTSSAQFTVRT